MCLEMYGLDPAYFLTAQGLEWHATLKKTKVKLYLITDFDILLIIKKASEAEYVMLSINMRKLIINSWKILIKIKYLCILTFGM